MIAASAIRLLPVNARQINFMSTGNRPGIRWLEWLIKRKIAQAGWTQRLWAQKPAVTSAALARGFDEMARNFYSDHLRNSRAPLVPPKPKEFDMAYSSLALRAWLGTKSMPEVSGSWLTRLMVGGRIWSRRARTVMPASRPPAPPRRWPVMDLVELTGSLCSPKKLRIAWASSVSPIGVDVPWALT